MKDINLVPKSYLLAGQRKIKRVRKIITVITGSIIIALCVIIPLSYKYSLQKQLDTINMSIEETSGYKTAEQKLQEIKQRCSERENTANGLAGSGISTIALLGRIEKVIPWRLFITKLNAGSDNGGKVRVTLTGISATEDDIASFAFYLREDNYFSDIVISSVRKTTAYNGTVPLSAIIRNKNTGSTGIKTDENETADKTASAPDKAGSTPSAVVCFSFNMSMYIKDGIPQK